MAKPYHDEGTLRRLYWEEGMSLVDIADRFGVVDATILYQMKKHGVERRRPDHEKPPKFVQASKYGYERIQTKVGDKTKSLQVHRLVAVAEHGFDAVVGNDIHHSNGVPWDNRPSNLEVIGHDDHAKNHQDDYSRDAEGKFA